MDYAAVQWVVLACPEPLPALLPRVPACSKDCSMARSGDGISRLLPHSQGEWTRCHGCPIFQMSPLLHALDDGDDPHQVPEQLVQLCMFYWVTPSPTNLTTFLLDDFFDKSLRYMLAVWPCWPFVCLWARGAVLSWDGTARSTVCATRNWWQSKARHWIPVITHGLYTHAVWQLPEPLKLVNFFEDRQSTPERTLRWLP